jgi:hydroxysqualene synthase
MTFSDAELHDLTTHTGGRFRVSSTEQAFSFCTRLAQSHYENFPVGSVLIPKQLRPHFYSIYAFSRIADDLADELCGGLHGTAEQTRLAALHRFEALLTRAEQNNGNPVFTALHATMQQHAIPQEPLQRLLVAFQMDSAFHQPATFGDVLHYCTFSANPVGELVLRLYGLWDERRKPLSDAVCTALQLVNFWQDISRDRANGRVYIPKATLEQHGLAAAQILAAEERLEPHVQAALERCLEELFLHTERLFEQGSYLLGTIPNGRLRWELAFTIAGGIRILERARRHGSYLLFTRPALGTADVFHIFVRAARLQFRQFTR